MPARDLKPTQAEFSVGKVDKAPRVPGRGSLDPGERRWLHPGRASPVAGQDAGESARQGHPTECADVRAAAGGARIPSSTLDTASEQATYRSKDEAIVAAAEGAWAPPAREAGLWPVGVAVRAGEAQPTAPLWDMSAAIPASPQEDQAAVDDLNRALGVSTESMSAPARPAAALAW